MKMEEPKVYEAPEIELLKLDSGLRILDESNTEGETPGTPGGGGD